jgi:hypothetical protein
MNFSQLSIPNPKRKKRSQSAWDEFFPYYAGYPDGFARNILSTAQLDPRAVVLDPWNGSGTTTYVASQLGFSAIGLDLNPAMVVVARSRMLPCSEADTLSPLVAEIVRRAATEAASCAKIDPLLWWFEKDTADWLRSIELSIRSTLLGDLTLTPDGANFDRISSIAATLYVGLFNLAKSLVSGFQSSNPTWLRKPKAEEQKYGLPRAEITQIFQKKIKGMSDVLLAKANLQLHDPAPVNTRVFDSTCPFGLGQSVDLVLTSPPYCTRIDYTAATRIQLAVLHPLIASSIDDLSRDMVGSIKVPKDQITARTEWGVKCLDFLQKVSTHDSYASRSYYLKTHVDYFYTIDLSTANVSSSHTPAGAAILVVQDSHYKEIRNDVPSIVVDIASQYGLELRRREDFQVKTSMSGLNPRARIYNKHSKLESVLCFQKVL